MFFKEVNEIDLGETTIANIFIDIFMPMANGLYVKVYLLGYRQACDPNSNPKFDNNSIAKNLNIPLSDVIDAWKFWQNKKQQWLLSWCLQRNDCCSQIAFYTTRSSVL